MTGRNRLIDIRDSVMHNVGAKVILKADRGRKKIVENFGTIESAYPSVFTVVIDGEFNEPRRVSYSYSDVLTSTVEITICGEDEESALC